MRQVASRALGCLRRPFVVLTFLALAGGGAALVRLPLLGQPGYELSAVLSVLHGLFAGIFGIAAARQEGRLIRSQDPRPKLAERFDSPLRGAVLATLAAWALCVVALLVPFIASLVYAATSTACDPTFAIAFFPVLTLPSSLLACALGVFAGFASRRVLVSAALYFLLVLATLVPTLWPIVFGPQVFAYNHLGGYLPGPLYDEALSLPGALWWFRLETLLVTFGVLLFTANLLGMRDGRLERPHFRLGSALLLGAVGFAVFLLEERGPALGTRMTDEVLAERLGGRRETEHFVLVHPRGMAKEDVERTVRDLEFRHAQISTFLGGPIPGKVTVWWYRNADEKQRLVGAEHTQFAKPWRREVHVNAADFPHPVIKHELVHALAAPFGAKPFGVTAHFGGLMPVAGIIEGLAVAGDDPLDDLTLHEWAAGMKKQSLLPDVRKLMRLDGFYDAPPSRAYATVGSFLRWLGETQGGEKLRKLYEKGDFEGVYGKNVDLLANDWETFLGTVPLEPAAVNQAFARFRQGSLFQRTCAREVASLTNEANAMLPSDPEGALAKYQRAALLQPQDFRHQTAQAAALQRSGRRGEAAELLAALAPTLVKDPSAAMEVAMTRADLAWAMQKPAEAEAQLKAVLELEPSPAMDRTAHVKLAAIASPEVGPAIWEYFRPGGDDVKLLTLREALTKAPGQPEATYLIGRKLELGDQPMLAVKYLSQALSGTLAPSIAREATRLKVEARFLSGDCAGLREEEKKLPDWGTVFRRRLDEWLARCDFEEKTFGKLIVPEDALR